MSRDKIIDMLKDIVSQVDHDIYKGLFVSPEDTEFTESEVNRLVNIVKHHIK